LALRRALLIAAALLAAALGAGASRLAGPRQVPACGGCHEAHYAGDGACTGCHRGRADTRRESLAHERLLGGAAAAWGLSGHPDVAAGERLRESSGCRRCHVSGGEGLRHAIALDDVVWEREQADLRASILRPVSTMPDFGFTERQADQLVAVLLRDARGRPATDRYQVRFLDEPAGTAPHAFTRRCGPCHRALTRGGPLGTGFSGPDLTGLLTRFYPAADGRRWDAARLERWLRNPRAEQPHATMPPVTVEPAELDAIVDVLGAGRDTAGALR
jgi:cytochrome c2